MPGPYAIGVASVFFSTEYKRLGDYAAGTVVVRERPQAAPLLDLVPGLEEATGAGPVIPSPQLVPIPRSTTPVRTHSLLARRSRSTGRTLSAKDLSDNYSPGASNFGP